MSGGTNSTTSYALYSFNISQYATNGDILNATDSVNGTWAYTYDNLRRLQTATLNPGNDPSQLTWAYDGWGDRSSQRISEGSLEWPQDAYSFSTNNQIEQDSYDAAGNEAWDGFHTYTYDDEGRIVAVDGGGTAQYVYDADGLRVHKTGGEGPEDFVYDLGGQAVTTYSSANGGWVRGEIYAGAMHVGTYANSTTYFSSTDWQGTERVRSNVSGNPVESCSDLPFGDDQNCTGSDPSPLHLTDKMRDTETGLDYFGARYYSSNAGRWMLPDWSAVPAPIPYADRSNSSTRSEESSAITRTEKSLFRRYSSKLS